MCEKNDKKNNTEKKRTNNSGWWPLTTNQIKTLFKENFLLTNRTSSHSLLICILPFFIELVLLRLCPNRYYLPTTIYRRESISETLMRYWYCSIIWYIYFYGGHYSPSTFSRFFYTDMHTTYLVYVESIIIDFFVVDNSGISQILSSYIHTYAHSHSQVISIQKFTSWQLRKCYPWANSYFSYIRCWLT